MSNSAAILAILATLATLLVFGPPNVASHQSQPEARRNPDASGESSLSKLMLARLEALADLQKQSSQGDRRKKNDDPRYVDSKEMNSRDSQSESLKQQLIMKKRLHKLLEDLSDEDTMLPPSNKRSNLNEGSSSFLEAMRKRDPSTAATAFNSEDESNDEKIMILVKKPRKKTAGLYKGYKKSTTALEDRPDADEPVATGRVGQQPVELSSQFVDGGNQWDTLAQRSRQMQAPERVYRRGSPVEPSNLNQHARRILDDSFGIMNESKFSTNNHIGFKGVPKFGSEEEY